MKYTKRLIRAVTAISNGFEELDDIFYELKPGGENPLKSEMNPTLDEESERLASLLYDAQDTNPGTHTCYCTLLTDFCNE